MGDFGEPWTIRDGQGYAVVDDRGRNIVSLSGRNRDRHGRIVACVNAMVGLDPVKVRELIDELAGAGCCGGTKHMMEVPCGECRSCRARACREDAG